MQPIFWFLSLLLAACSNTGHAQADAAAQSFLYTGIVHKGYPDYYDGIAYFHSRDWQKGSLVYGGEKHPSVTMLYDLVQDKLVLLHPSLMSVELFTPRIQSFNIGPQYFVYIAPDSAHRLSGIYQHLVSGKLTLLAKRQKKIDEQIAQGRINYKFIPTTTYHVYHEGVYLPVKSESAIMQIAGDKKREIKKLMKENGVSFKKDPEAALVLIVKYLNNLDQ